MPLLEIERSSLAGSDGIRALGEHTSADSSCRMPLLLQERSRARDDLIEADGEVTRADWFPGCSYLFALCRSHLYFMVLYLRTL